MDNDNKRNFPSMAVDGGVDVGSGAASESAVADKF